MAPYPATNKLSGSYSISADSGDSATKACTKFDSEYRLPNIDELISMWVNNILLQGGDIAFNQGQYLSSTVFTLNNTRYVYEMLFAQGTVDDAFTTYKRSVWCVKR